MRRGRPLVRSTGVGRAVRAAPRHWLDPRLHLQGAARIGGVPAAFRNMAGGGAWRPPRSCEDYWWEWKHCRGLRHAFHHYYAHGELPVCDRWREDYEACHAWEKDRSAAAQEALCKSERARVMEKQKYAPVWTLRKNPPSDWYLPLDQEKPN